MIKNYFIYVGINVQVKLLKNVLKCILTIIDFNIYIVPNANLK